MDPIMYSNKTVEWETPIDLFNNLNNEFKFDLDVCASNKNYKCNKYYTIEDDGLKKIWFGNIWCNPPYGREIYNWVKKAFYYNGLVVMLLPARTDTKWFHEFIYNNIKCEIRFLKGRIRFSNADRAPFPSMICIFRG